MKFRSNIFFLTIFILSSHALFSQSKIVGFQTTTRIIKQYELAEWNIDINGNFTNPYLQEEVAVDMMITSPTGKELVLPCFFESRSTNNKTIWKARFLPQERGPYAYHFRVKAGGRAVQSKYSRFVAESSPKRGIMHKNDLWTFRFDNGELYRGLGENICWESRDNDDSKYFKTLHQNKKYNYEYMLSSLAKHGGDYYRAWICPWNLPLDWKAGFNNSRYTPSDAYFNPSAILKLDRLVNLSDSLGLHIMLTLGSGSYDEKNGRHAVTTENFFIDPIAKAQYKNRLRFIVARWGYSTAISAWEFFNEVDNIQFKNKDKPIESANIVSWHAEMSAYLSGLDPYKHLITTSISHRDLKGLNSIEHIDFNQKHIYKNNLALPATIVKYSQQFKKPYVIGEYGYEYDWQKNFDDFAGEMDSDFKRALWYGLFTPTPVLPMSWWWEYFDNRGTDAYLSNVRTVLNSMMNDGHGSFKTIKVATTTPGVQAYAVQCGVKTYLYVYNGSDKDRMPEITCPVQPSNITKHIKMYACELGTWGDVQSAEFSAENRFSGFKLAAKTDIIFVF